MKNPWLTVSGLFLILLGVGTVEVFRGSSHDESSSAAPRPHGKVSSLGGASWAPSSAEEKPAFDATEDSVGPPRPAPLPRFSAERTGPEPSPRSHAAERASALNSTSQGKTRRAASAVPSHPSRQKAEPALAEAVDETPALQVPLSLTNPDQAATIPAALAVLGEDTSPESPHQLGIEQLAAAFLEKVDPPATATPDAGYAARWTEAQLESDARMKAGYGQHVWLRHHADVYRQAFAPPADPAP